MQTKSEMINRIAELAEENAKLKAENERLKADKDKYYQQTLDDEIQINELYQVLQEIKAIVKNICNGCTSECDCDEDCNYFLITEALDKAEEE